MTTEITLAEQHILAFDAEFINRVRQAMVEEAIAIMTEDSADAHNGTPEYEAKMRLAITVINDANYSARQAALLVATKSVHTDASDIDDSGYRGFVQYIWLPMSSYNPHRIVRE